MLALVFLCSVGCATSRIADDQSHRETNVGNIGVSSSSETDDDYHRVASLWKNRSGSNGVIDYPVGSGDLLEISVPGMEELKSTLVRVSNEGKISLPFIGVIHVGGLTEREIKQRIVQRLQQDYMHDPQLTVQVREYRARQIAITGAVAKPGLYSLTSGVETLQDAISLAGGMTKEAAPRILFTPAESSGDAKRQQLLSPEPAIFTGPADGIRREDPIVIDLNRLARGNSQRYMLLPLKPGDFIVIPSSGEVLVEGWVEKPGSYKISPRLTLLGAVAAAGGATFAGDNNAVRIVRAGKTGDKIFLKADLEKIKSGEASDIPVQEGDVIEVPGTTSRMFAYGIYRFFTTLVHVGASVPIR